MARKASLPVVLHGLERLAMRIVAGAAPKTPVAVASASAESKLLDVAYDFESPGRRSRRHDIMADGEGVFQALPRYKVAELFSWIEDTRGTKQVTLFADAVAGRGLELCRVDNRARTRTRKMPFDRTVAALAGNGFRGENRGSILIQSARDKQCGSGMAENTFLGDRAREIWIGNIFVARRQIIGIATAVESQGRLEKMPAHVGEVTAGVCAGTDDVVDAVVNRLARIFPALPITRRG